MVNKTYDWPDVLGKLIIRQDIDLSESRWAMDQIMSGNTTPEVIGGFLAALATKGECASEVQGLSEIMVKYAQPISLDSESIDIVGTGGDRFGTVNISTMAALVVAAGGHKVVKHGNRASSSASGSADILERLGVQLDLSPVEIEQRFHKWGMAFLFANLFHPAMKYVAPVRRSIRVPTVFNILGPLSNPAQPKYNLIGVYSHKLAPLMAKVLSNRKAVGLILRGTNGLDEISTVCLNQIWIIINGQVRALELDAVSELGLKPTDILDLRGGQPEDNAQIAIQVLSGKLPGAITQAVAINAAAALSVLDFEKCLSNYIGDSEDNITTITDRADEGREKILNSSAIAIGQPASAVIKEQFIDLLRSKLVLVNKIIESGKPIQYLRSWAQDTQVSIK